MSSIADLRLEGKVVVMKAAKYKGTEAERRFLCQSGFGCNPKALGTAVFGTFLVDGEEARVGRYEIEKLSSDQSTVIGTIEEKKTMSKKFRVEVRGKDSVSEDIAYYSTGQLLAAGLKTSDPRWDAKQEASQKKLKKLVGKFVVDGEGGNDGVTLEFDAETGACVVIEAKQAAKDRAAKEKAEAKEAAAKAKAAERERLKDEKAAAKEKAKAEKLTARQGRKTAPAPSLPTEPSTPRDPHADDDGRGTTLS